MTDQYLEDNIITNITNAITSRMRPSTKCQVCGKDSWGILAITRLYTLSEKKAIPTVSLACTTCGHILTFDLKTLGFEDLYALLEESKVATP